MQLGTILLAGVCGVVGLVAGRASAPTGPIIIAAGPPPRVAPVIVVAPPRAVAPDHEPAADNDDAGTDVAAALATLHEQVAEHAAPTPASEIFGHVTDANDEPAVGCTMVALSPNLVNEQVVMTDEHGDYRITGLPPGYYSLTLYYNDHTFMRTDIGLREIEPTHFDIALSSPSPHEDYIRPVVEPEQELTIVDGVGITFSGSDVIEGSFGFE